MDVIIIAETKMRIYLGGNMLVSINRVTVTRTTMKETQNSTNH